MKSRRDFIKNTAIAGAGLTMLPNMSFGLNSNVFGKEQKIRVGMIGVSLI